MFGAVPASMRATKLQPGFSFVQRFMAGSQAGVVDNAGCGSSPQGTKIGCLQTGGNPIGRHHRPALFHQLLGVMAQPTEAIERMLDGAELAAGHEFAAECIGRGTAR